MSRYRRYDASDFVLLAVLFIAMIGLSLLASLLAAQFVCFGLSYWHVQSGIAGPWFVLAGINMAVGTSIWSSRNSK